MALNIPGSVFGRPLAQNNRQTPTQAILGGRQAGAEMQQLDREEQIRQLQAQIQQESTQPGFNPLGSAAVQQLTALDPRGGQDVAATFGALSKERKRAWAQDARKVNNLIKAGNVEDALSVANNRLKDGRELAAETGEAFDEQGTIGIITALQSGDPNKIAEASRSLDLAEQVSVEAGLLKDTRAGARKGKDKQFETIEVFKQLQELKASGASPEVISDFRQLAGLDKAVKLSSNSEATLIKAQDSSFAASAAVRKMDLLADDISKIDIGGGLKSSLTETLKELLGSQNEVSKLRREFRSIRSSQATKNLPPGPASDKDIALALSGFPGENAPAEQIISFLRGQAKLARMDVAFNDFKSDYISEHSSVVGFGKAWRKMLQDDSFVSSIFGETQQAPTKQAATGFSDEKRARLDELRRKKAARGG